MAPLRSYGRKKIQLVIFFWCMLGASCWSHCYDYIRCEHHGCFLPTIYGQFYLIQRPVLSGQHLCPPATADHHTGSNCFPQCTVTYVHNVYPRNCHGSKKRNADRVWLFNPEIQVISRNLQSFFVGRFLPPDCFPGGVVELSVAPSNLSHGEY